MPDPVWERLRSSSHTKPQSHEGGQSVPLKAAQRTAATDRVAPFCCCGGGCVNRPLPRLPAPDQIAPRPDRAISGHKLDRDLRARVMRRLRSPALDTSASTTFFGSPCSPSAAGAVRTPDPATGRSARSVGFPLGAWLGTGIRRLTQAPLQRAPAARRFFPHPRLDGLRREVACGEKTHALQGPVAQMVTQIDRDLPARRRAVKSLINNQQPATTNYQ